jgi:hypothetical protein
LNGTLQYTQTVTVNTSGAQFFALNFTGINELDIFSSPTSSTTDPFGCGPSGCSQVTLDDLIFNAASGPPPPPVPEPASFLLAFLGLSAAAAFRRLKSSRASS